MNWQSTQLYKSILKRQENCEHPPGKIEHLNGHDVCIKCAKVMGDSGQV